MMHACLKCGGRLKKAPREIEKGVTVEAWVCTKCAKGVYLDMQQYGSFYEAVQRRAFKVGGSLAIRLPKELARAARIKEGTPVVFRREGTRLIIEAAEA